MKFYVEDGALIPGFHEGDFLLEHCEWNDWWRYENLYTLKYVNQDQEYLIGQVKIGDISGDSDQRIPAIPNSFDQLDSMHFVSLGQGTDYYAALNALGLERRVFVLTALNDIAYNLTYYQKYNKLGVIRNSLLRDISVQTVTNQFHRMANGGAVSTPYEFEYIYPTIDNAVLNSPHLCFSVVPDSTPPTNIHVLIGRNGVGKTWLLKNMIESLYTKDANCGQFVFEDRQTQFSNIVCLAFSVFDQFPTAQSNEDLKYTHIGVRSSFEGKSIELDDQFAISLTTCMTNKTRYKRWKDIISILNSDPIFAEINLVDYIEEIQNNRRQYTRKKAEVQIKRLFRRLSSGHKIVALAITRLVETVEECTLVLLDEPELHLHPPLLSAFTRALSQLLIDRNGVAIITTHSPVILQEVPKSCVWILRRSGQFVSADRPEIETFGENVGSLTSEVFRLEVMESGFHKMLKEKLSKHHGDFEDALEEFEGQLGSEAVSLLKIMSLQYGGE